MAESPAEPACARRRAAALGDLFLPDGDDGEGTGPAPADADIDWDVPQPSEADYDDPAELFTDSGIPIEPFHLKAEREEGYFDRESGGYVRLRRVEGVEDAWADALAATDVDARWAAAVQARRRRPAAGAGAGQDEGTDDVSDEVTRLKQRIVSFLLPGENALAALRRLGRARGGAGAASGGAGPSVVRGRVGLTPEARSDFDRLTECSAALMDAGEYMAHSLTREELLGGGGGGGGGTLLAEDLLKAAARGEASPADGEPAAAAAPSAAPAAAATEDVDMFAGEAEGEGKETAAAAPQSKETRAAGAEAPAGAAGDAPLQGFVLDSTTGYFYNSQMGAYYDPRSRLFGDAASGTWWRLDAATGRYVAT